MPDILSAPLSFGLQIAGLPTSDLAADLFSVRFVDSLSRKGLIEATLIDGMSLKYSQNPTLQTGTPLTLIYGTTAIAAGTITGVASRFDSGSDPTIKLTATLQRAAVGPMASLELTWGSELITFDVMHQASRPPRRVITASGTARGLPGLRPGVTLSLKGLGTRWSGDYAVSETTHTFDVQRGYLVTFSGSR